MVIYSPCLTDKKELAILGQTTTGKEFSNPLMAGSLPKTISAKVSTASTNLFWNTATSKTVNSVKQMHAIVDGNAVVISESSMRNDLLFNDENGITCLINDIFENLALMGNLDSKKFLMYPRFLQLFLNNQLKDLLEPFNDTYVTPCHTKKDFSNMARKSVNFSGTITPLFASMLVQNQAPEGEAHIEQILLSPTTYQRKRKTQKCRRTKKDTELPQTSMPLDHGADEAVHKEEIQVAVLGTKKPWEVLLLRLVETSSDDGLDEEDASKQGRRSDKIKLMFTDKDFEELDDHMENVEEETIDAATTGVSTAEPRTPPSSTTVFDDEDVTMEMAQTLIKMKEHKAKEKGVAITDVEDSSRTVRLVRSITTLQPLPTIDPKDKGSGYKYSQMKGKTYEEIHELYERHQKRNQDFIPMDSEKEAQKSGKRLKIVAGSYTIQKSPKKSKVMKSAKYVIEEEAVEYEKEKEEL
ncbi:hypothetical protein Tco_1412798, partial [Tanacetum coccineum]